MSDHASNLNYFIPKHRVNKRIEWWWCTNHKLSSCGCDLHYTIVAPAFSHFDVNVRSGTIARVEYGVVLSDLEMYVRLLVHLEKAFERIGDHWKIRSAPIPTEKLLAMLTLIRPSPNWTPLPAMAEGTTSIRSDPYPTATANILKLMLMWDLRELSHSTDSSVYLSGDNLAFFSRNIWQKPDLIANSVPTVGYDEKAPAEPYVKAMREKSMFNLIFGHRYVNDRVVRNSVLTTNNVDAHRLLVCDEKLRREVRFPNHVMNLIARHTKGSLRMLYKAFGTEDEFGKHVWSWEHGIENFVYKKTSSAGLRPGQDSYRKVGKVRYHFTVGGSKGLQLPFMRKIVEAAIKDFESSGLFELPQVINAIGLKKEFLYTAEEDDKAAEKMQSKLRYIWLSETLEFLVSSAVQGYRQKLERRGPVLIGSKFSHGGAYEFAKKCHYNSLSHFWIQGDFSSYDLSLKRFFLNLFAMENLRYFDRNSFPGRTWELFVKFNEWVSHNLGCKLVRKPNGEWGFLEGSMGSGSYMTSHGDSWILAFTFYLFIETIAEGSEMGEELRRDVMKQIIGIFVFGDDFVIFMLKKYRHLINKKTYAAFMEQLGMIFKELEERDTFLSTVDSDCYLVQKNVKLLQHYFIDVKNVNNLGVSGLPPVLPWKDTVRLCARAVYGNGEPRVDIDYAISAIGNAYASHGTNEYVYKFYKYIFDQTVDFVQAEPDWIDRYLRTVASGKQVGSMLRKAGIQAEDLVDGFPTRKRLLERNRYVAVKHKNWRSENDFIIQ